MLWQGYTEPMTAPFKGGEREALRRFALVKAAPVVLTKPKPNPHTLDVTDHILSPYMKFGCLSAAKVYK